MKHHKIDDTFVRSDEYFLQLQIFCGWEIHIICSGNTVNISPITN